MNYSEVVQKAKHDILNRKQYGNKIIHYRLCNEWLLGDQINLWSYWQGYQIKDIDNGVDILLVGQDWGNPDAATGVMQRIRNIQSGMDDFYYTDASPTDRTLKELFQCLGCDISKSDTVKRLFFTNYSLGYRCGSETGGMTKSLMKMDDELFRDLVAAIKPKVIICLGKITYESVTGSNTVGFLKKLRNGIPFKSFIISDEKQIPVYGVAHCGARGVSNVGGKEAMIKAWNAIGCELGV